MQKEFTISSRFKIYIYSLHSNVMSITFASNQFDILIRSILIETTLLRNIHIRSDAFGSKTCRMKIKQVSKQRIKKFMRNGSNDY